MDRLGLSGLLPSKAAKPSTKRVPDQRQVRREDQLLASQEESWLSSLTPEARAAALRYRISREQLYEEVWAEPIIKVAERYGVSDVAVAKWCRKLNVPRPGRGYWARRAAGQQVKQRPLPGAGHGQSRYVRRPEPRERTSAPPTRVPGLEVFENPIPVSEVPDPEHPLVARTRRALHDSATRESGIISPSGEAMLDVSVGEASVKRALRIMHPLIRAIERAGFSVEAAATLDGEDRPTGYRTCAVLHWRASRSPSLRHGSSRGGSLQGSARGSRRRGSGRGTVQGPGCPRRHTGHAPRAVTVPSPGALPSPRFPALARGMPGSSTSPACRTWMALRCSALVVAARRVGAQRDVLDPGRPPARVLRTSPAAEDGPLASRQGDGGDVAVGGGGAASDERAPSWDAEGQVGWGGSVQTQIGVQGGTRWSGPSRARPTPARGAPRPGDRCRGQRLAWRR
jgi:hypothetical protein